jgi:hypothetical protein
MIGRRASCRHHRAALVDLVDRGERGPATAPALDHLAGCPTCERELTEIALTIVALRRTGHEVRRAPVPEVRADRVRRLAVAGRDPWRWRLQLGSLLTGTAIAALAVAPSVGVLPSDSSTPPLIPERSAAASAWQIAETQIAAAPDRPSFAEVVSLPPRYPEGLRRPWKEVFPTDATPHGLKPS